MLVNFTEFFIFFLFVAICPEYIFNSNISRKTYDFLIFMDPTIITFISEALSQSCFKRPPTNFFLIRGTFIIAPKNLLKWNYVHLSNTMQDPFLQIFTARKSSLVNIYKVCGTDVISIRMINICGISQVTLISKSE